MPFCPQCKYEYKEGITECPDCNAGLVEQLPDKPEVKYSDEEFAPVFVAKDSLEAAVVKGIILEAGIPVIEEVYGGHIPAPTVYGIPDEVTLTVPISRVEDAKKAIEEAMASGDEMSGEETSID